MKIVAYHISQEDKELLALANHKKHKITIIICPLDETTVHFAETKDAVVTIDQKSQITTHILEKLISFGVKYFIYQSQEQCILDPSISHNSRLKFIHIGNVESKAKITQIIELLDHLEKSDENHSQTEL